MRAPAILLTFAIAACATEAPTINSSEQNGECEDCPDEDPLFDCDLCDEANTCNVECRDSDGHRTTCAEAGYCQSCDVCSPDVSCDAQCVDDDGVVTTCETQKPLCQRFDVYCALPLIVSASISDTYEEAPNGPLAYMYFGSAAGAKSGNYPVGVGGISFDPNDAWASNFRGPAGVPGERTQWEWTHPDFHEQFYPFIYGHAERCQAVAAGSPRPALADHTEQVWEDDECWGPFCNDDDHVGAFTMQRSHCDSEVFADNVAAAFSEEHRASGTGSVRFVDYQLFCYSCLNSASDECTNGVDW